MIQPKVFISYSWSSKTHQQHIKDIAERLAADGVETVIDIYDLKEGDDKNYYMERMIQDKTVTHVLVICDKKYSEKADLRKDGVGVESMIISQEIYSSVSQSKFIPLIFEYRENGEPYTPIFLNSRIYIDFSTPEKENDNWERLIRLLYGKPEFTKPPLGKPPVYLQQDSSTPTYEIHAKFQTLKSAIINQKPNIKECRRQFLEICRNYCVSLQVVTEPTADDFAAEILQIHRELIPVRDAIIDWISLEGETQSEDFSKALLQFMEVLLAIRNRPKSVNSWSDFWFLSHQVFSYETFLYILAALIKIEAFQQVYILLHTSYLLPDHLTSPGMEFANYSEFFVSSDFLQSKLAPENYRLHSPVAELVKLSATREDVSFDDLKQADLVALMISFVNPEIHWYPQLLLYSGYYDKYPLFTRAIQHRGFKNIATITGINDSKLLVQKLTEGDAKKNTNNWHQFSFSRNFLEKMNISRLDSIN
ncbi:TIR domain-containing protein [Klebsiella quasipneumoniae]|uniref:TIR domain-containing protein n=1 Tax=Klebsiella quasipneumoniae TaxID=1463165 RepID=UPI000808C8C0|nr:TIR domain-containing protein [Klebsiella quasipneumoniae]SBZ97052.1 SEFIR domain [Klebsiella quasipneumoniae]